MKLFSSLKRLMPKQGNPNDSRLWPSLSSYFQTLNQQFFNKTRSNITVTGEDAFIISAFWCAVRAISEDIAKLPVKAYTATGDGNKKYISNNKLLTVLTKGFNPEVDSMTGMQTLVQWMLVYGNAYAEIQKNPMGDLRLYLIHPSRVDVRRDPETRELYYLVESTTEMDRQEGKTRVEKYSENEFLHLKGPNGNGILGQSLVVAAGESLGISMAAQNFTGAFFGNNLSIGATLETPRALDPDVKEAIRKEWSKKFGGSSNAGDVAILDRDFKFNRIQMASTDAEMLKTREFQVSEIARWFRIPPHKIMEMKGAKFNNVEQQNIEYVTDCLGPWIARLETQLKFRFHRTDNTYIDIDEKALLRGDQAARVQYYKELYMMSAITPQMIAKIEGLPHEDAPADYYQQLNIQSVSLAEESQQLDNEAKTKALEEPEPIEPEPIEEEPEEVENEPEPQPEEEAETQSNGIAPEAFLAYYMPVMEKSISLLVQKESRAHEAANKKQGYALKEHLEKFYSKFETEFADKISLHIDCLCGVFGKESPERETLMAVSKEVCQMSKDNNWQEVRASEVCDMIISAILNYDTVPLIGEIVQGDDGEHYIMTNKGPRSIDVIPKL